MVDENGFLVDDDAMSRVSGDDQEDMEDLSNPQCLDRDLYLSDDSSQSSGDEDGDGDQDDTNPGDQDEILSPPRVPDRQGAPEVRPSGTPGLATNSLRGVKLLMRSLKCLQASLRNVILLMSNLERWADQ